MHTMLSSILDLVFPAHCISCGTSGADLCLSCISEFPGAERESAKWIFPLFDYRHPPAKKALWLLKYKNKRRIAAVFAEMLYGRMLEELSELQVLENFNNPLLIPIPLSPKRYRERGYNQAELICLELVNLDTEKNIELNSRILIKIKETEHQARIKNRNIRLKNLENSYGVKNEALLKGRNII